MTDIEQMLNYMRPLIKEFYMKGGFTEYGFEIRKVKLVNVLYSRFLLL